MAGAENFSQHMEQVARALLGVPNKALSTPGKELRFGTNGSLSIDLKKGTWFDHSAGEGGGVLDLIAREKGLRNGAAVDYMRGLGMDMGDARAPTAPTAPRQDRGRLVATYDYVDEAGKLLYQALRFERAPDKPGDKPGKTFSQRRPPRAGDQPEEIKGGFVWNLRDTRLVPFRLPELLDDLANDRPILIIEGEKAVNFCRLNGLPATCNPMGAKKWPREFGELFRGARVAILPDNDIPGRAHAAMVADNVFVHAAETRVVELPGLALKEDVVEWLEKYGGPDDLLRLIDAAPLYTGDSGPRGEDLPWGDDPSPQEPEAASKPRVSRYGRLPFSRLDDPGPELRFIIDDLFTENEKSVIAGASMSGKSFLAIAAAMAIATGTPLFGKEVLLPGLVVYQAGEGARGIKKRLRAYRKHFGLDPAANIPFELLQSPIDLYRAEADTGPLIEEINWIARDYPESPLRLVVIDTLATATGGADENSGKDMGAVMANIDRIRRETGAAVLLVHHMNANGNKLRGHTSIFANTDQVLSVELDEATKIRTARLTKQKDEESGAGIKFELMRVVLGQRPDGKEVSSCVCLAVGEKDADRAARAAGMFDLRGGNRAVLFGALVEAVNRKGMAAPSGVRAPGWASCVHLDDWREEARRKYHRKDGQTDAQVADTVRKAVKEAAARFEQWNLVEVDNEYVWRTKRKVVGYDRAGAGETTGDDAPGVLPIGPLDGEVVF